MSSRCLFPITATIVLVTALPAAAQLPSEPKTPYLWRIVLKTHPHPLLSPTFRDQLRRDLEASLQPVLGTLGVVEVVDLLNKPRDQWDPLWQQFDDKGFAALEAPRDLTVAKTHFLKLEYKDGQYLLESRQHDGFTGLASGYAGYGTPVIRKQSERAPELVGRKAGIMLNWDFGLDGTVEPILGTVKEVKVLLRGRQLGSVNQLVKPGDIFAVSEVSHTDRAAPPPVRTATGKIIAPPPGSVPPPGLTSKLRTNCLLKVEEVGADGVLKCEVLSLKPLPLPQGKLAGLRCMKLGTVEGSLTIRLTGNEGKSTSERVSVRATEKGFDAPNDSRDLLDYNNRDGLFRSARPLAHLANITVELSPTQKKTFSVPVLNSDPIDLLVRISAEAEEQATFDRNALAVVSHVADARNAQTICFEATARLIDRRKNTEALSRAKGGHEAARVAALSIEDDLKSLRETADKSKNAPRFLKTIEQHLEALKQFNVQLETHINTLQAVVNRENDPSLAAKDILSQGLLDHIKIYLEGGDVDQAISAYDQLVMVMPENAEFKTRRDKLKADWQPKDATHAKARDYLLKTWPALTTFQEFKDSLPELGKAIDECKKQQDRFALRKLLVIFTGAAKKLNELHQSLDLNSEAEKKDALAVGEALAAKENEVREAIKKIEGK